MRRRQSAGNGGRKLSFTRFIGGVLRIQTGTEPAICGGLCKSWIIYNYFYKKLIALRKRYPALVYGDVTFLYRSAEIFLHGGGSRTVMSGMWSVTRAVKESGVPRGRKE